MLQLGLKWIPLKGVFIDSSIRSIPNKAMSEDKCASKNLQISST